jgi:hypothetical protein
VSVANGMGGGIGAPVAYGDLPIGAWKPVAYGEVGGGNPKPVAYGDAPECEVPGPVAYGDVYREANGGAYGD